MAKADLERARELYPSCGMGIDEWMTFFGTSAGLRAMGRILYDIYDEVVSREEREAGQRRIGRRPAREATTLANVMAVVKPEEFSNEPLPVALRKLIRGRPQRQFAAKVPISQGYLNRLLSGQHTHYDLELLEALAEAGGVPPWHFPEWRAIYIGDMVRTVLTENPNMGITALRGLRNARRDGEPVMIPASVHERPEKPKPPIKAKRRRRSDSTTGI